MSLNAHGARLDAELETLLPTTGGGFDVAHTLKGEGHDASEDGTGRGNPLVPVAIQERAVSESPDAGPQGAGFKQDDTAFTLEARHHTQAVAFSCKDYGADARDDVAPTMRAMGHDGSHPNAGGQMAVAFAENDRAEVRLIDGVQSALSSGGGKLGQGYPAVMTPWAVRRLIPLECERLQGFPDGWTAILTGRRNFKAEEDEMRAYFARDPMWQRGDGSFDVERFDREWPYLAADGPRYKALGNSWALNCGEWVFDRIRMVSQACAHSMAAE